MTLSSVVVIRGPFYLLREMGVQENRRESHKHTSVTLRAIRQRSGVPYEIERKVCSACQRVLDEKPLKRALA
jgi:hypothetical protein